MPDSSLALVAHPLVRWLLDVEPDVKRKVQDFCAGNMNGNSFDVAGPPTDAEIAKYRKNESKQVGLPCVTLRLSFVKHHLSGEKGLRVDCAEAHIGELSRWHWRWINRETH